ncbi:MAG TPA: hypothetical protein VGM19_14770 [Armatimonadota bacterium]
MYQTVTLDQFSAVVWVLTGAGLPLGLALGALAARLRRDRRWTRRGLLLGLLGPLVGCAWLAFSWTVRIDPVTHYVGLYRPGVLAADVAGFLAAGYGLGRLLRRWWR